MGDEGVWICSEPGFLLRCRSGLSSTALVCSVGLCTFGFIINNKSGIDGRFQGDALCSPRTCFLYVPTAERNSSQACRSEDSSASISGSILAFYSVFTGCVLVGAVLVLVGWVLFVVFQKRKISKWYQKGKACETSALLVGPSGSFKVKPLPSRARALNI